MGSIVRFFILCAVGLYVVYLGYALSPEHPKNPYASPRYCYDEDDDFKSDVCSKIGKQWNL
jgi:hypothetical protein